MADYKDFWHKSDDGLRLHARDYGSPNAATTVVCIPGLTRNAADFAELCERLAPSYRLLALDLRGRGESEYDPNPMNYHPMTYVADTLKLLDAADVKAAVLIGTSLGGIVSMVMAALHPQRVQGLILNDVGPEVDPAGVERIKGHISKRVVLKSWQQVESTMRQIMAGDYPDFSDAEWQRFCRNLFREDDNGMPVPNYDPEIAVPILKNSVPADVWLAFKAITAPTLLVHGGLSYVLNDSIVARMRKLMPDMGYVKLANRGHVPTLTEPESLAEIEPFLAACRAKTTELKPAPNAVAPRSH